MSPVISASIYHQEGQYENALRTLQLTDHIEASALQVQILVAIERPDQGFLAVSHCFLPFSSAKKLVSKMDEDSTLTQLCGAWTNIALGGEKAHDAYYAFQELMDKTQTSPILLNGAAAAHIAQQKWEEADGAVKEATEKDINCPETLINQIMVRNSLVLLIFNNLGCYSNRRRGYCAANACVIERKSSFASFCC